MRRTAYYENIDCNRNGRCGGPGVEALESRRLFSGTAATLPASDVNFLHRADSGDALEVTLGNLAQTHASSSQIKAVGSQMVTDHSASMQALEQGAASLGVTLSGALETQDQAIVNRLSKLSGAKFDVAYSSYMIKDHRMEVSDYTRENQRTSNATIKTLTANEIPVLQTHLSLWEDAQLTAKDIAWVPKAASGNVLEVTLGNLAQTNASSAQVKAAGQRMVTDHGTAEATLTQTASTLGIPLPGTLDSQDQAVVTRLSKLSGTSFDRAYSTYMVGDHKREIADYTRENKATTNSLLKSYTATQIPILQSHLALWETTVKSL